MVLNGAGERAGEDIQKGLEAAGDRAKTGMNDLGDKVKDSAHIIEKAIGDAKEDIKATGKGVTTSLEAIKEPVIISAKIAALGFTFLAGAAMAKSVSEAYVHFTAGAEKLRSEARLNDANTHSVQVETAGELAEVRASDNDSLASAALDRMRHIVANDVDKGALHDYCVREGKRFHVVMIAIVDNTAAEACFKTKVVATPLPHPDFAYVNHRVYTSNNLQSILNVEERLAKTKLADSTMDEGDLFKIYFVMAPSVREATTVASKYDISNLGPYISKHGEFHGDVDKGTAIHFLPASLKLWQRDEGVPEAGRPADATLWCKTRREDRIGEKALWGNDTPIIALLSSPKGKAFLHNRFHNILFYGTNADLRRARSLYATAMRHSPAGLEALLGGAAAVCASPVLGVGAVVVGVPVMLWYVGDKGWSTLNPPTFLFDTQGLFEPRTVAARDGLKAEFGWRVSRFCKI